ncbi:hypothetical protein D3C72_1834140 [compost metagenome]
MPRWAGLYRTWLVAQPGFCSSCKSSVSKFDTPQRPILPASRKRSKASTVSSSGYWPRQCNRYRSIWSVPRRLRLRSQAAGMPLRLALCG